MPCFCRLLISNLHGTERFLVVNLHFFAHVLSPSSVVWSKDQDNQEPVWYNNTVAYDTDLVLSGVTLLYTEYYY